MATTDEILAAARDLGKLILSHPKSKRLHDVLKKLEDDADAQRLLLDYQRHLTQIAQQEAQGQPVEVQQKKTLDSLQSRVIANDVLKEYQLAQMDYLDLMRKVDESVSGAAGLAPEPAPA